MSENLDEVSYDISANCLREEWPMLKTFRFQGGLPPLLFATLPKSIIKALGTVRPQPPQTEGTELDAGSNVAVRPDSQPALSLSYRN